MAEPLLSLEGVHTHIGRYHILHGVDFNVQEGEVVTLLGRNGAGKTTTMKSIMGLVGRRAHAAFTKQKVSAFIPVAVLSSLTTSSTLTRQLMLLPSPWARMLGCTEGKVVDSVNVHGKDTPAARCGLPSRSM